MNEMNVVWLLSETENCYLFRSFERIINETTSAIHTFPQYNNLSIVMGRNNK